MQARARFYSKNVYFYEAGIWIYGKKVLSLQRILILLLFFSFYSGKIAKSD